MLNPSKYFTFQWFFYIAVTLLVSACVPTAVVQPKVETAESLPSPTSLPEITVPIAVYLLDGEEESLSSQRTAAEVRAIYEKVNEIWEQANISLDVQTVERVSVPDDLLRGIGRGDFFSFFDAVNDRQVNLPQFSPIMAFYVRDLGGPNGINPVRTSTFFVMDTPSVHDERVTSHEIGHIFGLHHVLNDPNRLLFSGTNGMELDETEIIVSRYGAEGLLQGLR